MEESRFDPQYAAVKAELSEQLDAWMQAQGDQGQQTELEAFEHQNRNRKKRKGPAQGRQKRK